MFLPAHPTFVHERGICMEVLWGAPASRSFLAAARGKVRGERRNAVAASSAGRVGGLPSNRQPFHCKSSLSTREIVLFKEAVATAKPSKRVYWRPMSFVHLHTHTTYSLLEGALRFERVGEFCRRNRSPAVAITDRGNMFGALEFSQTLAEVGVQPIVGICLPLRSGTFGRLHAAPAYRLPHLVLLAKDEVGYGNLMKLASRIHLRQGQEPGVAGASTGASANGFAEEEEAFEGPPLESHEPHEPHALLEELPQWSDGLLCLTGGAGGVLEDAFLRGGRERAGALLSRLAEMFPDRLYVELQRHGLASQASSEHGLVELAYDMKLPLVASNDARFHRREEYPAYDVLCCIEQGVLLEQEERRRASEEHYLKTPEEMEQLFSDVPEAIENSVEIARRCSWRPQGHAPILPRFAAEGEAESDMLRRLAREGLQERLARITPAASVEEYAARLETELDVIISMNYTGYFLVVADFIRWAHGEEIPVGPGRGSGAGSLVAYALTITDIDPLRFGLLFERFLNAARISMPDFDIDFCPDRRERVIRYVCEKYGRDRVAHIITFGTLQARAVLRDVGRVLGVPHREVDRLCKLVPYTPANPTSLERAIAENPALSDARDGDARIARMMRIAMQLEGLYRHASTHAAGIVISENALDELVPLYRDPRSDMPVTQFSMKWAEQAGLVKFDFLGLKTLSIVDMAARESGVSIEEMPFDDAETFAMLQRGETMGVFQVEGSGMRDTLRRMGADRIEDVIALIALYRPGPMDNIPRYIECKHGQRKPDYLHDTLQPVLEETYGVIVYQEQVIQIARALAGFSLNEADLLRRAMGKKDPAEMSRQKERFLTGAVEKGISRRQADRIFEQVSKFAGYGFNKSHAAAYAILVYRTAYLKAHFPAPFLAACMSWDMGNADRLRALREESERVGAPLHPPCVNRSGEAFEVVGGGESIMYALAAVRNVGRGTARHIVEERERGGAFRDMFDFAHRVSPRQAPKRAWEFLAKAGAFDALEPNRHRVLASVERLHAVSARVSAEKEAAQDNLFGGGGGASGGSGGGGLEEAPLEDVAEWSAMERLRQEFEAVGFHLSGHPLDPHGEALARAGVVTLREAVEAGSRSASLAGVVTAVKERKASSGNRYAFLSLSDRSGEYETVVFSEVLHQARELLAVGALLVARVTLQEEDGGGGGGGAARMRVEDLYGLEAFLLRRRRGGAVSAAPRAAASSVPAAASVLEIRVGAVDSLAAVRAFLDASVSSSGGREVVLVLPNGDRDARLRLPGRFSLSEDNVASLRHLEGVTLLA